MQKRSSVTTVGQLISKMPLDKNIKASSKMIETVKPFWRQWSDQNLTEPAQLLFYKNEVLTIQCTSAICATQLRHQQQSLIDYLASNHCTKVKQVEFIVQDVAESTSHSNNKNNQSYTNDLSHEPVKNNTTIRARPSDEAIESLKNCEKTTKNERLAKSLRNLRNTIKNIKS